MAELQPLLPLNNFWHSDSKSDTVFVFVHGFFSDSKRCWTSADGQYWPDLIIQDARLGCPGIFMAGYYTDVDSGMYSIADCAREVFDAISTPTVSGQAAPIQKTNIVFICHSLGGIVIRYLIEHNRESFLNKSLGLILMASPSFGSDYATDLRAFARFYKNRLGTQLQRANPSLTDLDERFKSLLEQKKIPNLIGAEAIEHHFIIRHRWLPGFKPVVTRESSARYFGEGRVLAGTDHATIVKPTSLHHVSHQFLVKAYLNKFLPISVQIQSPRLHDSQEPVKTDKVADALFEVFYPALEKDYIKRDIDKRLSDSLKYFSIWTHGESGTGKTSAIRRTAFAASDSTIQVYIGAAVNPDAQHEQILLEAYYTVTAKLGIPHKSLQDTHQILTELSDLLVANSERSDILLVLDELPLLDKSGEMERFIAAVCKLIVITKQKVLRADFRLLVTSIFDPEPFIKSEQRKISEQLRFLKFERWSNDDILKLMEHIEDAMPELRIVDAEKREVLETACGSPRFIKMLYKNYKLCWNGTADALNRAMSQTAGSLNQSKA